MAKRTWKRWTEKEIELLIDYYKSGLTVKQIQETFVKTRSAGSVAVKVNQLQKEGKIQYRQKSKQPKAMQEDFIPQKVIAREKIIIKLSKEIKTLKGQLESARKELKAQFKSKNDIWNEPYTTKWSKTGVEASKTWDYYRDAPKTPEWVKAGKKAMQGKYSTMFAGAVGNQSNMNSKIADKCDAIKELLQLKNAQYGDSALNPVRVFSKADSAEQLKVRIDDKLSRLVRGDDSLESDEEIIKDLIGYLVLLLIQYDTQAQSEGNA